MLKSILTFFLDPFHIFLLLAMAVAVTGWVGKKTWFKGCTIAAVIWLMITSTGLISGWMLTSLEYQYLPADQMVINELQGTEPYIVVLGAGHGYYESHPSNVLLSQSALRRLNEGIRLHNAIPGSRLVLSGHSTVGNTTGAEMLNRTAVLLGVDEEGIRLQNEPLITAEEANFFARDYGINSRVVLVTNASHMPRAVMLFEQCGVNVTPSPAFYRITNPDNFANLFPSTIYMEWMRIALYEYAAITRDRFRSC
jgi:uncharacterized SAM-binding protein YcdF (DUF218 family)